MVGGRKNREEPSQQYRRCEGEWSGVFEERRRNGVKIEIKIPWNGHRINDGYREHRSSAAGRVTKQRLIKRNDKIPFAKIQHYLQKYTEYLFYQNVLRKIRNKYK